MKIGLVTAILIGASIAACASDPNKKIQEARVEDAETTREQREKGIDKARDQQIGNIENRANMTEQQARQFPEGTQQRAKAQADLTQDRQTFQAKAQARLQKAQAKLDEARTKMQLGGGRVETATHDKVTSAATATQQISAQVNRLSDVPNEHWAHEKARITTRLDEVEKLVDDASSKADDAKP